MKKKQKVLTVTNPETGSVVRRSVYELNVPNSTLKTIREREFVTHSDRLSARCFRLGNALLKPTIYFCFLFLFALKPSGFRESEQSALGRLLSAPKMISIPSRLLVGLFSTIMVIFLGLLFGLPGKILKIASNRGQPDIAYLVSTQKATRKLALSHGEKLRIATYNTALTPPLISFVYNKLRDPYIRVKEIISLLLHSPLTQKAHAICLQEVFPPESAYLLCQALQSDYEILYNVAPSEGSRLKRASLIHKFFGVGSGLFFASQFPIYSVRFVEFPMELMDGRVDALSNKGLLMGVIQCAPDHYCLIGNIHLQARGGAKYERIRHEQLLLIHACLSDYQQELSRQLTSSNQKPIYLDVFISGDFNISNRAELKYGKGIGERFSKMNEFFFKEYLENPLEGGCPTATWTIRNKHRKDQSEPERIVDKDVNYDLVLHRKGSKSLLYQSEMALIPKGSHAQSDHLAVVSEFTVSR